jgi:hypothetical protein
LCPAKARLTSAARPSPTLAVIWLWVNAGRPRACIWRFNAAARSGTVFTNVPSRSSSRVRATMLTENVAPDALALARERQVQKPGRAPLMRAGWNIAAMTAPGSPRW